ncbi:MULTISPECIES: hypothetical protein [unclassified Streptomyces]|uniref:hypothetical protein n=1 Tax=unclassified Streptomyces TaxID=2593676 RepID=UPI0036EC2CA8
MCSGERQQRDPPDVRQRGQHLRGLPGAKGEDFRYFELAAASAGSEFCVKHPSGDIALLVVQVKNTALWDTPGMSSLMADVSVWRAT